MNKNINYYDLFRPINFKEIIGEENNVQFCINSIEREIFPNLIILYGSYGSGKTTLARIYAKAINCIRNIETKYKPCGSCINCINSQYFIKEYNSSNYTQLDHMRETIEDTKFKPYYGRFKVYILDEIHMISSKSMSMLLKEVEEPYEHVKYICITNHIDMITEAFISRSVLCFFNILTSEQAILAIPRLLNKCVKNNIDINIKQATIMLKNICCKNFLLSYRTLVNAIIQFLILDKTECTTEDNYVEQLISIIEKDYTVKEKIFKINNLYSNNVNSNNLLDGIFKYYINKLLKDNNKENLVIAEMILENKKNSLLNYQSMLVLILKIHFFLNS